MSENTNEIVAKIGNQLTELRNANASAMESLKVTTETKTAEAAKAASDAVAKVEAVSANLLELEQKLASKVLSGGEAPKSLGQIITASAEYKSFAEGRTAKMRVEANTITGQAGSPVENSNILVAPQRLGMIGGAFSALRIRDVVPAATTSSNAVEYTRELAWTNDAAETAEGAAKPESDLTFELKTANIRTIAHFIKASKQILDDAPMLQSYIDTRMRYGVDYREDRQFINGNGVGQNIEGMTYSGNFTAFTPTSGDTALDSLSRAQDAILAADYAATAILMNPADWGKIARLKDDIGNYIVGNPLGMIVPMAWGLPVVLSNGVTSGKFLMANFQIAYGIVDRMGTVVEMFEQDDTNVQKNLLTIRAEKRSCMTALRPASTRYGNLVL